MGSKICRGLNWPLDCEAHHGIIETQSDRVLITGGTTTTDQQVLKVVKSWHTLQCDEILREIKKAKTQGDRNEH